MITNVLQRAACKFSEFFFKRIAGFDMSGGLGTFLVDFHKGSVKRSPTAKNTQ